MNIKIIKADITTLSVDAIVNAANSSLYGGGGVDGAIHRAAGPKLLEECGQIRRTKYKNGLPTGQAVITKGYGLPAKYVIHTVGPVYDMDRNPERLLSNAFSNSLRVAEENKLKTIAFPAISTGIFGYPKQECAEVGYKVIGKYPYKSIEEVTLCLFSDRDKTIFEKVFKKWN